MQTYEIMLMLGVGLAVITLVVTSFVRGANKKVEIEVGTTSSGAPITKKVKVPKNSDGKVSARHTRNNDDGLITSAIIAEALEDEEDWTPFVDTEQTQVTKGWGTESWSKDLDAHFPSSDSGSSQYTGYSSSSSDSYSSSSDSSSSSFD